MPWRPRIDEDGRGARGEDAIAILRLMLKKLLVLPLALAVFAPACLAQAPGETEGSVTTVILVRHAEKDRSDPHDNDPRLTDEGHARAAELVHVLGDAGIDVIYSTPYRRTRDTARPLAKHLGLDLTKAPVGNHAEGMARRIRERHAGQTVLVSGHSNTTPEVARALGVESVPIIEDHVFDELWVITIAADSTASMTRLKYGEASGQDEKSDEPAESKQAA